MIETPTPRPRRNWTPKEKLEVILAAAASGNISEICRRYGISVNMYYEWKQRLFKRADLVFNPRRPDRAGAQLTQLELQLQKKDAVIAEITQENLELKRGSWR